MAIKTFTDNTTLPASDINSFLANSGLVYITSGALSLTTTNFVGCFTSTYNNYRIVLDNGGGSAAGDIYFRMLNGSTPFVLGNYYWAGTGFTSAGAAANTSGAGITYGYFGATFSLGGTSTTNVIFDIYSPLPAVRTQYTGQGVSTVGAGYNNRNVGGSLDNITSYDGIQFASITGINMSGNVTIYGYRKV